MPALTLNNIKGKQDTRNQELNEKDYFSLKNPKEQHRKYSTPIERKNE